MEGEFVDSQPHGHVRVERHHGVVYAPGYSQDVIANPIEGLHKRNYMQIYEGNYNMGVREGKGVMLFRYREEAHISIRSQMIDMN